MGNPSLLCNNIICVSFPYLCGPFSVVSPISGNGYATIVNRNTGTINSAGISLYVEEDVHDVAVLNDVLLTFDSELSCGSAGRF